MAYRPPFSLNDRIVHRVAAIAEQVGAWRTQHPGGLVPALRRGNRIRSVQASLAVEQNTLSVAQVTAVLDGKTVLGPAREIHEVRNAFAAYEALPDWRAHHLVDLLAAHACLMQGLVADAGQLRQGDSGIFQNERLVHAAPPASQLPRLVRELLGWLKTTDTHPLVAGAAFHYEFEFIHPFSDGNGRMGRLWQTLILSQWQPLMAYLPVETVIKHRQAAYYQALGEADQAADCTDFIAFMLDAIHESLAEAMGVEAGEPVKTPVKTPVETTVKTPERILDALAADPTLSLAAVAAEIGRSLRAVERAAATLQVDGKLQHTGPRKGGRWIVTPIDKDS